MGDQKSKSMLQMRRICKRALIPVSHNVDANRDVSQRNRLRSVLCMTVFIS
jgi:hypothetical protein